MEDKYIWEEFKNGKDYALSYIYLQNIDFLFFYGKKFTADEDFILDVVQDLFYDLIKSRKNLNSTDNIRLYLIKSFRRKLLYGIGNKRKLDKLNKDYNLEPDIIFSVEEELITSEDQSRRKIFVRKGMRMLNAKQREIFYYKFSCGFDYPQICEIMSISYDSARKLVSRGINSLKQYMSENNFVFMLVFRRLVN